MALPVPILIYQAGQAAVPGGHKMAAPSLHQARQATTLGGNHYLLLLLLHPVHFHWTKQWTLEPVSPAPLAADVV